MRVRVACVHGQVCVRAYVRTCVCTLGVSLWAVGRAGASLQDFLCGNLRLTATAASRISCRTRFWPTASAACPTPNLTMAATATPANSTRLGACRRAHTCTGSNCLLDSCTCLPTICPLTDAASPLWLQPPGDKNNLPQPQRVENRLKAYPHYPPRPKFVCNQW